MPDPSPHSLSSLLKRLALDTGFTLAAISRAKPSAHPDAYHQWIADKKHGEMHYLATAIDHRLDISQKFPWARSILSLALAYHQPTPPQDSSLKTQDSGKIARYAWGRDYHKILEAKLRILERTLRTALPHTDIIARAYVDTGPLLERELAANAGLGWIGKHTLLIHPTYGSFFLLGELVLNLDAEPDSPIPDHCGTCTRCIQACPTHAITPYSVDATKCISYLTLEHRSEIPEEFHAPMRDANFIAGCDICQDVCPFNRKPLPASDPDLVPRAPAPQISLQQILDWQEQDWDIMTRGRAFRRAKHPMWQRTAKILADDPA
ncbi:MAG TPA: tRNA epoxyqueuosine(34) reductase QueG [Phycisphaerae bacterium]|nr:tRNA epoxyqueuosine(34) reductase QueG [Phycisphaerae bacterium]